MMASFRTVLLLFVGLQTFVKFSPASLISSVKPDDIGIDQDVMNKNFFITCTICKHIIKTVERLLPIHKTEETVAEALKKVCPKLPSGIRKACDAIFGKYFKQITDLLLENAAPRVICIAIHMCKLHRESFVETCDTCSSPFSGIHDDALRMFASSNQGPKP